MKRGKYSDLTESEREQLAQLILSKTKLNDSHCTEWLGANNGRGYGLVSFKNLRFYVHRFLLSRKLGRDLLPTEFACHRCDNPPCTNGEHLFVGSHSDNMQDAINKGRFWSQRYPETARQRLAEVHKNGRQAKGEKVHLAKLSESDVLAIRKMRETKSLSIRLIAGAYGISKTTVKDIAKRKTWKHI